MTNKSIQLTHSHIGEGSKLFSVSITGPGWDGMAVHLVAGDDESSAIATALATYDMEEDAPTEWYAQEIGGFL